MTELPVRYEGLFVRAFAGRSRTAGIKAKCLECVGFVRKDITHCRASPGHPGACPLWPYRPYQPGDTEDDDTEGGEGLHEPAPADAIEEVAVADPADGDDRASFAGPGACPGEPGQPAQAGTRSAVGGLR